MSDAISTQGTKFYRAPASSPASFSLVPECRVIPGPVQTSEEIEVTHLDSTGGRREYIQSFKDADDLNVESNYITGDAVQALIRGDYSSGAINTWKVENPDATTQTFEGFVKTLGETSAVGEAKPFNFTVRITGAVTFS
jgi:predicted secreted protein